MRRVASLLYPRSIAVIGASNDPLKRGYQVIERLLEDGFDCPIYPVNPNGGEILGLRAYPNVAAIKDEVDLAILVTPAALSIGLVNECGRKGVNAVVVIAVGFGETGEDGRRLEQGVVDAAAEYDMALVGPNTNGVFNLHAQMNLVGAPNVPRGRLALLCQSGNVGLSMFNEAEAWGEIGFSTYVGVGNEAGVRYHELLAALSTDSYTDAVAMYAEGFRDGRAFLVEAERVVGHTPIVMYKAGRSEAASKSALSHTGSIAGQPAVADDVLRQVGVEVVERSDELLPVAMALMTQPAFSAEAIAVLADGGGHATITADALSRYGIQLAELDGQTQAKLSDLLPPAASVTNPIDVAGGTDRDPGLFQTCVETLFKDEAVGGVICVGLFGGYGMRFSAELSEAENNAAQGMVDSTKRWEKPLVVQSAYAPQRPSAHTILKKGGVGVHASVEIAVRCAAALSRRRTIVDKASTAFSREVVPRNAVARQVLTEPEGRELLAEHGIDVGTWRLACSPEEAADCAAEFGGVVALKIVSPDVVHKSDAGGVLLGVRGGEDARNGYEQIITSVKAMYPSSLMDGILVTPMAPDGVELLVGATTDATFGPVLAIGAGGTSVEILDDAAFRAIPVSSDECHEALGQLAIAPLLEGYRGNDVIGRDAIVKLMLQVSRLFSENASVLELDLNPVIAHSGGLALVDVRVVVGTGSVL